MRDVELDNGLRAVQRCPECHPDAVAVSMAPLSGTDATVAGWAAVAAQLAAGEDRAAVGRPAGRRPRGGARSSTADIDYSTVPINL